MPRRMRFVNHLVKGEDGKKGKMVKSNLTFLVKVYLSFMVIYREIVTIYAIEV